MKCKFGQISIPKSNLLSCGIHSQIYIYLKSNIDFVSGHVSPNIFLDFKASYTVVDAGRIITIPPGNRRNIFAEQELEVAFLWAVKFIEPILQLQDYRVTAPKLHIIHIRVFNFSDMLEIYDGPGFLSDLLTAKPGTTKKDNYNVYTTSTFQCLIYSSNNSTRVHYSL